MSSMQTRRALLLGHAPGCIPEDLPAPVQAILRQSFDADPNCRPSLAEIKQVLLSTAVSDVQLNTASSLSKQLQCAYVFDKYD